MPKVNYAMGLADNGIAAGSMWIDGQYEKSRAYRWPGSGPLQDLGVLSGWTRSFAWGVSGDGAVVVGHSAAGSQGDSFGQAFRWTAAGGMQGLGYLDPGHVFSRANAISRDGSTIVGQSHNFGFGGAFVWIQASGMQPLPGLFGDPLADNARAVNADGSIIVGETTGIGGKSHAVRWVNGAIEDLIGNFPFVNTVALAVSDNGSIIGGTYPTSPTSRGFIWSPATGLIDAEDYLALYGVMVPGGYQIDEVLAVSGDGLTFGGMARNLTTKVREGFVATIADNTCAVDCDASGKLDVDDFICFQTRFAIADPYTDCDESGKLNIDDFICFQTLFAVGC